MTVRPVPLPSQSSSVPIVSDLLQALRDTPVAASPPTIAIQAGSGLPGGATSTVTGTLYTPAWMPSTYYPAGRVAMTPDGTSMIQRIASGTSGASYDGTEAALWTASTAKTVDAPIRFNVGVLQMKTLNGSTPNCFVPLSPKRADGSEATQLGEALWSADFDWYTAAGALEVGMYSNASLRFIVDGQYVSATPTTGTSDFNWKNVKLSGVAAGLHRIRIESGGAYGGPIAGVRIATGDLVLPPTLPRTKRFMLMHDSFGCGYQGNPTAVPDLRGYASQLARILGFTDFVGNTVAASGFTTPAASKYSVRVADAIAANPDYLLVHGSTNDYANRATTLPAEALAVYQALKAGLPNAKILACGAVRINTPVADGDAVTSVLKTAAATAGVPFLDTSGWTPSVAAMVATDGTHPTALGHDYIARRHGAALADIWDLPI